MIIKRSGCIQIINTNVSFIIIFLSIGFIGYICRKLKVVRPFVISQEYSGCFKPVFAELEECKIPYQTVNRN